MAATTLLNAVSVNALATSANADFVITPPVTGVDLTLSNTNAGAIHGVVLNVQYSLDGTTFSSPQRIALVVPGETRQVYHDAKNCVKVRYTVHNNSDAHVATVTLIGIQV